MDAIHDEKRRQVIPRWRDFHKTVTLGELGTLKEALPRNLEEFVNVYEDKLRDWKVFKTTSFASDLLSTALILGKRDGEVEKAAEFLLSKGKSVPDILKRVALKFLNPETVFDPCVSVLNESNLQKYHYSRIKKLRHVLNIYPRNSLVWTDISREYIILGLSHKAVKAMDIALKLTPNNRFILRSAARLHLHIHDYERAHDIISKNQLTKSDPWLVASEIAIISLLERSSRFLKIANKMIDSKSFSPSHITELASSLGTMEMIAGNNKGARKLFRQALIQPNENSFAQAVWVKENLTSLDIQNHYFDVPCSFEAKSIRYRRAKEWTEAVNQIGSWLDDQPFSRKPAIQGSYLSALTFENYKLSEQFARNGLISNPDDALLLNNLAFALVNQNLPDEGEKVFLKIAPSHLNQYMQIVWHATRGLIYFRKGQIEQGRAYYNKAIEIATGTETKKHKAVAAIYLAREETRSMTPLASEAASKALELCKDIDEPEIEVLLRRIIPAKNSGGA